PSVALRSPNSSTSISCCHSFLRARTPRHLLLRFFLLTLRRPPTSTLFPYTTLFRSLKGRLRFEARAQFALLVVPPAARARTRSRSEEHTSELQSRGHLVCRLLLEKKKRAVGLGLFVGLAAARGGIFFNGVVGDGSRA